jgi:hypothetical protein
MTTRREVEHQIIVFRWAKQYRGKNYEWLKLLHSSGNGINSSGKHIIIAKLSGLLDGIPDIHLPISNGKYSSLYIELKSHAGIEQLEQKEMVSLLNSFGNYACFCYGAAIAQETIIKYLNGEL